MSNTVKGHLLDSIALPLPDRRDGKIRSSWSLKMDETGGRRVFVTSDRLSAFDRVLGCVPDKGQMLNQLAAWWFAQLSDIVPTHLLEVPDPNVLIAKAATPLRVEVIVRRAITGVTTTSLWQRYNDGARTIDGHQLPDGLLKNELLRTPLITPTTKADSGAHDTPLSVAGVVEQGLVDRSIWNLVCGAALDVFQRGEEVATRSGLILADTKYEFGMHADGTLMLIDEVHTPDSSRYWVADSYEDRLSQGLEPESLDKEIIRKAYAADGYRGDGEPPQLPEATWAAVASGYRTAYEQLTGNSLTVATEPIAPRILRTLSTLHLLEYPEEN